jgi:hypothetical protein
MGQNLARVPEDIAGCEGLERIHGRRLERGGSRGAEALDGSLDLLHVTLLG